MKMGDVQPETVTVSAPVQKEEGGKPPADEKRDAKPESSTENLPWHKDERFQTFMKEKKTLEAANSKLTKLLKENELDDPDDLEDLVKSGKAVRGKLSDLNALDELLAKSAKLDSYEAYWAAQKAKQQKETEDPTERAERLERELEGVQNRKRFEDNQKKQLEQTKSAITAYEKEVQSLISEVGIPKEHSEFVLELFGVNNPSNEVDITDKKAIRKLVQDGIKRVETYNQAIIANYLKEKKEIVKTGQGSEAVTGEKPANMNLKTAHKVAKEQIGAMFRGLRGD